jgi:hypothetical protein
MHSTNISLRLVNEDNLVRRMFDQTEMRLKKQDNKKRKL